MYNVTEQLISPFVEEIQCNYRRMYGSCLRDYEEILGWTASMALETIATSDALYHDVEHTILVTLVGQQILRGKHIREGGVKPVDWLHFLISHMCHDIGYVRGVCRGDSDTEFATGKGVEMVRLPAGATDAALTPYHVDRGKMFVDERFGDHAIIDAEIIKMEIEHTRFPVPLEGDYQETADYPGLLRAADLIGQLGDPRYLNKLPALFHEFQETGASKALGYEHPDHLRHGYPRFYWDQVYPYIQEALRFLNLTQEGKQYAASLYANVFQMEHKI